MTEPTPIELNDFTLHPRTWERWVPRTLLEEYVYECAKPIAVGHNQATGWFVLVKDPEPKIAYIERAEHPIVFSNSAFDGWENVGAPPGLPRLDGMVCNGVMMKSIFKIEGEALHHPIGKVTSVTIRHKVFTLTRIHSDLYRVLNIRNLSQGPSTA